MASTINGTSTGNGGLISTGDDSGILNIQTNETTAITVDASQKTSLVNDATINGQTVGKGGGNVATNTAHGVSALTANTSGTLNTAIGYQAGNAQSTGGASTFVGYRAGYTGVDLDNVTAVGREALYLTTGDYNTALGAQALYSNTTASNCVAVGYQALYSKTGGSTDGNVSVGYQAGYSSTSSTTNVFIGVQAGYYNTTGNSNVMIGSNAGALSVNATTGDANIYIGGGVRGSAAGNANEIVIGYLTTGKGSNTGFINPVGGGVYQGNNSGSWSTTSDQRLKKNIVDNTDGLDKITAVRVRNFEYRLPEEVTELDEHCAVPNTGVQLGVIAQELQAVLPDCVKTESTGVLSVDPDNLTWYMVNAIKELKAINDTQAETINALTARIVALETA
jgi:hypothetical protein